MNVVRLGASSGVLQHRQPRAAGDGVAAAEPPISPIVLSLILTLVVLFGYYLRARYWVVAGGLEPQYVAWAWTNHYGGIGQTNLESAGALYGGEFSRVSRAYPVGYPALIAVVKFLGVSDPQLYRLVQAGLDACASVTAYAVVRRLGAGQVPALVGACAYAITPSWAWSSTLIMGESLLPALTLLALLVFLSVAPRRESKIWFMAGLGIGLLPLFRPEMSLMIVPWTLWGVIHGRPDWAARVKIGLVGALGFALPWNLVAFYNYATHGQYFLTDNITGYALFCGLGQLPNPYGYFVDDERAQQLLSSLGIAYRSPEAEQYWRSIYWNAWQEHPGHVFEAFLFRVKLILFQSDIAYPYFKRLRDLGDAGPYLLLGACALLASRRQYARILIVAGPLLYAMASNGPIYVELRYVRYAHLSYLLAGCLLLDGSLTLLGRFARRYLDVHMAKHVRRIVAVAAAVPICAWIAYQTYGLESLAHRTVIGAGLRELRGLAGGIAANAGWRPLVEDARVDVRHGTPVVETSDQQGYQADYRIDTSNFAAIAVSFKIGVVGTSSYFHVSNRDKSLHYATANLPANSETSKLLLTAVEPPAAFLVLATAAPGRAEIAVHSVEYRPICAERREHVVGSALTWLRSLLVPLPSDFLLAMCPAAAA